MCVVSMIGDHYADKWRDLNRTTPAQWITVTSPISREEFDALKRDVEEMKALLKRAKEYDARNGEPDCEMDEKLAVLRGVAKLVGVDLDEVLGKPKGN